MASRADQNRWRHHTREPLPRPHHVGIGARCRAYGGSSRRVALLRGGRLRCLRGGLKGLDMWYRLGSRTAGMRCRRSCSKSGGNSMTSTTDAVLGEAGAREVFACPSVTVVKHEEVSRMNSKRIHVQNRKCELTTHTARPSLRPPSSSMSATRCRGLERWRGLGGLGTAGRGRCVLSTSFERKSHRLLSSIRSGPAQPF